MKEIDGMDDFQPSGTTTIMPPAAPQNEELRANMELARAASDARFMAIVKKGAGWAGMRAATPSKIENDEQYGTATALVKDMKSTLDTLEEVRLEYVAFPTKVVNMVNGLFRQTRQSIVGQRDFLTKLIARRDNELEQERARKLAEAARLNEGTAAPLDDGVAKVQFAPGGGESGRAYVAPPTFDNGVESTRPASGPQTVKVQEYEVEVVDLVKFLKQLVSKGKGNAWLADRAAELVSVNVEAVKEAMRANPSKRGIPGLKIVKL